MINSISVADLAHHVRTEHEAFPCDHCARRFQNKENLEEHVEEHVIKCDVCEERFFSEEDMVAHRREEHELEDCDLCDQRFLKTEALLEGHQLAVHGIKTKTIKQFGGGMMFMMVD